MKKRSDKAASRQRSVGKTRREGFRADDGATETIYRVTLELPDNGSSSTLLPVLSYARASEAAVAAANTVSETEISVLYA